MHRRRRLGYGYGGFPYGPFTGPYFSPFGPMPPSMRSYSMTPDGSFVPHHPTFMQPPPFPHFSVPKRPYFPYMIPPYYPYRPHDFYASSQFPHQTMSFAKGQNFPHDPYYRNYAPYYFIYLEDLMIEWKQEMINIRI